MSDEIRPMPDSFYPEITRYPTGTEDATGYLTRRCRHEYGGRIIDLGHAHKSGDKAAISRGDEALRQTVWEICEMLRLGINLPESLKGVVT